MNRFHYGNTTDANLLYLLQHKIGDNFFFLESESSKYVFLNQLEIGAFLESGNSTLEAVDVTPLVAKAASVSGDVINNLAQTILQEYDVREVVVPGNFPYALAKSLEESGFKLEVSQTWCPERELKSPEEISAIKQNFEHTKEVYRFIESVLSESEIDKDRLVYRGQSLTSEWLKREAAKILLNNDLASPEGMIISCGKDAAMPHHEGAGLLRPGETIVVDIFPQSMKNHYFADMTRTYVKGVPMHEEIEKMYHAVLAAQENSLKALRPGVESAMPYEISAGIIERAGFGVGEKGYIHSLGHGLGVAVHEEPRLSSKSPGELQVGQVVTVEPGLYYPEWGGVRIEDTVVITEDGYENLTNYPKDNWLIK